MARLRKLVRHFHRKGWLYAHHGDCIGGDDEFDKACRAVGVNVILHPPDIPAKRAFCNRRGVFMCYPPLPYLIRNERIVDDSLFMIACPKRDYEERRSGTWATIRYARKRGKRLFIIYPDGTLKEEQGVCQKVN